MRQINLLPPEVLRRRAARRQAMMLGAGVAGVVVLMLVLFLVQAGRLSAARNKLAAQQRTNEQLQSEVGQLSRFAQLEQNLAAKRTLLGTLTENEVRWSTVLADIAAYIPESAWLTQFTGSVQVQTPNTRTTGATGQQVLTTYGQVQMAGCTLEPPDGTHLEVAKWLVRLGAPREFINAYLTLSAKGSAGCPVTFNTQVQLDQDALRKNQPGGARTP